MKKIYEKPVTYVGIDALHVLTITLHTWVKYLHLLTLEYDKPQITELAEIIRHYVFLIWVKNL